MQEGNNEHSVFKVYLLCLRSLKDVRDSYKHKQFFVCVMP